MSDKYETTDAELEIVEVLWEKDESSFNDILMELNKYSERNKNTIKTLLRRLLLKGSIASKKINLKDTVYIPKVTKEKFLAKQNDSFLKKLYEGNPEKLVLNFVENKKVSKQQLKKLIDLLESED